jgi:hypothetical protein
VPGRQLIGSWMVALAALLLLAAPVGAASGRAPDGPEPPLGWAYAFELEGSNGFELIALPGIGYGSSSGGILLVARNRFSAATYKAPATVTAETPTTATIEADLGALGRISVRLVPTGRQKSVRVGCEGKKRTQVEAARYEGTIEFHGEEGFTEVSATGAPVDYEIFRRITCSELESHSGRYYPRGASLEIRSPRRGKPALGVSATKLHPGGRTWVTARTAERRGEIAITRELGVLGRTGALRYDEDLGAATLRPPAPFAGQARFDLKTGPASRWTGNLTVDFPGRSDVPLTGPGFAFDLFHPGP